MKKRIGASPIKFKLISRLVSLLVIEPSKAVYQGLAAHNTALKEALLEQYTAKEFYRNFLKEWKIFKKGLRWLGSKISIAKPLGGKSCPDCTFAQDLALVIRGLEEVFLISPKKMGAKARRKEAGRLRRLFGKKVTILELPGRIDFGDVIAIEINGKKVLLIGVRNNEAYKTLVGGTQKLRTTKTAIDALTEIAKINGYEVVEIEHTALHLTSAMTMAGQAKQGDPLVFLHNECIPDPTLTQALISQALELKTQDVILIATQIEDGTPEEKAKASWSASCVGHNGRVLVQKGAKVANVLRELGFEVKEIPFEFIMSIDGGMTCLILELIALKPVRKSWKKKASGRKRPRNLVS